MPTVTTDHQLANLALGFVGQRQFLDSLNEDSEEGECCAIYYPLARDSCLKARAWRFATRRSVLALSAETRTDWDYVYTAPNNLLTAHEIYTGIRNPPHSRRIPFALELNDAGTGHLILTDQEQAELIYTAQLNIVALWPADFVEAVAWRLACYLALALPVKPQLAGSLEPIARRALLIAAAADQNAVTPDQAPDSEFILERA